MTLHAGEMRHRIILQRKMVVEDPEYGGGATETWVDVIPIWAKRSNNLRVAGEAIAAGTTIAPVHVRFDIWARAVDMNWRAVGVGGDHDGVVYDIQNIGHSNDGRETALLCMSGTNNG